MHFDLYNLPNTSFELKVESSKQFMSEIYHCRIVLKSLFYLILKSTPSTIQRQNKGNLGRRQKVTCKYISSIFCVYFSVYIIYSLFVLNARQSLNSLIKTFSIFSSYA